MKQLKILNSNKLLELEQTDQIKWELLKYGIPKFAITYSKKISQNTRRCQCELEKKSKEFESNFKLGDKF